MRPGRRAPGGARVTLRPCPPDDNSLKKWSAPLPWKGAKPCTIWYLSSPSGGAGQRRARSRTWKRAKVHGMRELTMDGPPPPIRPHRGPGEARRRPCTAALRGGGAERDHGLHEDGDAAASGTLTGDRSGDHGAIAPAGGLRSAGTAYTVHASPTNPPASVSGSRSRTTWAPGPTSRGDDRLTLGSERKLANLGDPVTVRPVQSAQGRP